MAPFKIPKLPATTNKTIRFPDDVIEEVEAAIAGKECTFSAFVIAAVRNVLDSEYRKPYVMLFNDVTDAIQALDQRNIAGAKALLMRDQQQAEAAFLEFGKPKSES